jgi:hypothetical protein
MLTSTGAERGAGPSTWNDAISALPEEPLWEQEAAFCVAPPLAFASQYMITPPIPPNTPRKQAVGAVEQTFVEFSLQSK